MKSSTEPVPEAMSIDQQIGPLCCPREYRLRGLIHVNGGSDLAVMRSQWLASIFFWA
jgi:hypothetical protein